MAHIVESEDIKTRSSNPTPVNGLLKCYTVLEAFWLFQKIGILGHLFNEGIRPLITTLYPCSPLNCLKFLESLIESTIFENF